MDSFQGDLFAELLDEDRNLAQRFDGFVYYPNITAVAPITLGALPAIYSGSIYTGGPLREFYKDMYRDMIFSDARKAGYSTVLYGHYYFGCPAESCVKLPVLVQGLDRPILASYLGSWTTVSCAFPHVPARPHLPGRPRPDQTATDHKNANDRFPERTEDLHRALASRRRGADLQVSSSHEQAFSPQYRRGVQDRSQAASDPVQFQGPDTLWPGRIPAPRRVPRALIDLRQRFDRSDVRSRIESVRAVTTTDAGWKDNVQWSVSRSVMAR
jgi:hypothetical protein